MRHLIQENRRDPTVHVMQPEFNEDHFEEGNYSRTMIRMEPQVFRRNNPMKETIDMDVSTRISWHASCQVFLEP